MAKVNECWIEMEKDTGALLFPKIVVRFWKTKKPKSRMITHDGHEMRRLGCFDCAVEGNSGIYTLATLSEIECGRSFGLAGRDLLVKGCFICLKSQTINMPF